MNKACFIDRDGALIEEKNYLSNPDQIILFPASIEALKILEEKNFLKIVITNQAGVARGYFTEKDIATVHHKINDLLAEHNVKIDDFFYCPHHPEGTVPEYTKRCECRKPGRALIDQAVKKYDIDIASSFLIGDKISDLLAGRNAGCPAILVKTGHGPDHVQSAIEGDFPITDNILEAVQYFIK